jgi:predicted nuclease with RNAse H fold
MEGSDLVVGFDPGGERGFGCCVLRANRFETRTVSSIDEAMRWAIAECGDDIPVSAGIDTLLHWSDGLAGWRRADLFLRKSYPKARASVMPPNALYGAMAVGGVGLALRLRERWHAITLTETHPKVLFYALSGDRYRPEDVKSAALWFVEKHHLPPVGERIDEHQFDALISAWAARQGRARQRPDLCEPHSADMIFPAGPVSYLWPKRDEAGM